MTDFLLSSGGFAPAYLRLYRTGELKQRARDVIDSLASCQACPRNCRVDRLANETGICKTGRFARVSTYFPHAGEEECLRGSRGSGTIFFSWCALRCRFCQNHEISHLGHGTETRPEELAEMMLELQAAGCHNINFVTPEHVVPQILEALVIAVEGGLSIPLVYNTSSHDSMQSLLQMDSIVDVYLPDFKFWDSKASLKYLASKNYPEVARRSLKEMQRQVGELKLDEHQIAKRGVLVRHLVLPNAIAGTREIMKFLAREISPHTYVNLMAQYSPSGNVSEDNFPELNRWVTSQEYADAVRAAQKVGLYRFNN